MLSAWLSVIFIWLQLVQTKACASSHRLKSLHNACIVYKLFAILHYSIIHFVGLFSFLLFLSCSSVAIPACNHHIVCDSFEPHISSAYRMYVSGYLLPHHKMVYRIMKLMILNVKLIFHNCCAASVNFVKLRSYHVCASCVCVCVPIAFDAVFICIYSIHQLHKWP